MADLAEGLNKLVQKSQRDKRLTMTINSNSCAGRMLVPVWDLARASVLDKHGPLSIRLVKSQAATALDITGCYGEEVQPDASQIEIMKSLAELLDTHIEGRIVDTLTVAQDCIIETATASSVEFDIAVHRRRDALGCLVDVGDGFEPSSLSASDLNEDQPVLFLRDPVVVNVHDVVASGVCGLAYTGSFDVDQADMAASFGLDEALDLEEDEEDGRLVCDIHESIDGLRSITITRDAMTPDGPTRRILYSELHA